jgi:hypothetical protein
MLLWYNYTGIGPFYTPGFCFEPEENQKTSLLIVVLSESPEMEMRNL